MMAPELARFDELVSRYLDGSLGDADEHELVQALSDEALAACFHEATQLNVEIAGVLAGGVPDEVMIRLVWSDVMQSDAHVPDQPANVRAPRSWTPVLLALAAAVVVLAGAAFYLHPKPLPSRAVNAPAPTVLATATSVRGEVYLVRAAGRESVSDGLSLGDGGTIQTMGRDSRVTLALHDGSEIELKGDTTFTAELGTGQHRLFLEKGMLVATVVKQPENEPLVVHSTMATATVRGTRFALVEYKTHAYLTVIEGAVGLQRASGGPVVRIEAGFYGHVEPNGQFRPFPISHLPRALREELPKR
ncbi:MAG: FecR family protein [Verrucomicrobiota bacterium]